MSSLLLDSSCRDQVAQARTQSAILVHSLPLTSTPKSISGFCESHLQNRFQICSPLSSSMNIRPVKPLSSPAWGAEPPQSLCSTLAPTFHHPSLCTVTRMVLSFKRQGRGVACSCMRATSSPVTAPLGPNLAFLRSLPLGYSQYMPLAK